MGGGNMPVMIADAVLALRNTRGNSSCVKSLPPYQAYQDFPFTHIHINEDVSTARATTNQARGKVYHEK